MEHFCRGQHPVVGLPQVINGMKNNADDELGTEACETIFEDEHAKIADGRPKNCNNPGLLVLQVIHMQKLMDLDRNG